MPLRWGALARPRSPTLECHRAPGCTAQVMREAWDLSLEQPFMLLTCDGCAHCGAGVPADKIAAITRQMAEVLASWGITGGEREWTW